MDNITATIVLGATGGINSGLLTAHALDKLQVASMSSSTAMIVVAGAIGGMALVAAFRAVLAVLNDATPKEQLI